MIKITLIAPYRELAELAVKAFNDHINFSLEKGPGTSENEYEFEAIVSLANDVQGLSLDRE